MQVDAPLEADPTAYIDEIMDEAPVGKAKRKTKKSAKKSKPRNPNKKA